MTKKKKPDLVVFNEETKRYDAAFKPYATGVGAPQIKAPNNSTWKNSQVYKANKQLKARYESLKAEYEELMVVLEYNELVTSARFSFEPQVGEVYHLYNNEKEAPFLSIIEPSHCNFQHLGSFKLNSNFLWDKVDNTTATELLKKDNFE